MPITITSANSPVCSHANSADSSTCYALVDVSERDPGRLCEIAQAHRVEAALAEQSERGVLEELPSFCCGLCAGWPFG